MLNKVFAFIFVMILIFISYFITSSLGKVKDEERLSNTITDLNKAAEIIFNGALISSEVLKEMIELSEDENFTLKKFNRAAKKLLEGYSHVDSILLLPNGVVSYVYPYDDNKNAIGHDILSDENRKLGSMEAISKKDVIIIGPVKLVQNGKQAFIVRRTVRTDNGFWGFISSIVYLESIIDVVDNVLSKHGVDSYLVLGYNPDCKGGNEKLITSKGSLEGLPLKGVVRVFNTRWELTVSKSNSDIYFKTLVYISLLTLFLLVLLPIRYFKKYQASEKQKIIFESEAHTDFLTGLLNRRGFEHRIKTFHNVVDYGSVAILDIDFFKKINDTYGHDVGDEILVGFVNFCREQVSDKYALCRSGGEEFILLMPATKTEQAKEVCDQLRLMVSRGNFVVENLSVEVRISVGIAGYRDTNEIKSALTLADKALYRAKQEGRDRVYVS
ncbi:sensor domain-containing diguanylate cyclase [Shewanella sp. D64]|uniref:sensor domain-containing diguanylate cyclase n=1 Tax=unclassified Shewanella TaxID=196818 RepID=UPI0022BA4E74|nr:MULTISPECIES: sensor domain-containing diguanylate cyclase [unclassified Shewanella]MEC4727865.1 sensor domain-containing diguanylate cyclase [Shewanella sp. D64]MEC4739907.1 sensor domain-containing diguanylate cyclase [Shewanella sp. E94]WBJ97128.1 sensor domain-containing diguanylate cyclase [Shewanella sp. MTB7]